MHKLILTLLASSLLMLNAQAQDELLTINPDAQSLAMGGVAMTNISSPHSIFANPAASIFSRDNAQLSGSYLSLDDHNYAAATGYYKFDTKNLIQAGWRRHGVGGDLSSTIVDVGYSRKLGDNWSIGAVGRYLYHSSTIKSRSSAFAVDISAMYSKPLNWERHSTLRIGMKLGNIGGYIPHDGDDFNLRSITTVSSDVGIALDTFLSDAHQLTFAIDLGCKINEGIFRTSVGAEYNIMQLFQVRAGYHHSAFDSYTSSYGSVGAGVRFFHMRADLAYIMPTDIKQFSNSWCISFGLDF